MLKRVFFTGPSIKNNELNQKGATQQENGISQEDMRWHDRLYLMQQKSEQYRNEISRLMN